MWSGLGAKLRLGVSGSPAIELFGEGPSRLVLSSAAPRPGYRAARKAIHLRYTHSYRRGDGCVSS